MSNLFLKNNVKNIMNNNSTESSLNLNKILNISSHNNIKPRQSTNSVTSSNILQSVTNLSSTSYDNIQNGGASVTSSANMSKINSSDINNLLSMLTSESNVNTASDNVENKLKSLLNQNGGAQSETATEELEYRLKNLLQTGGNMSEDINTEVLENKLKNIINKSQKGGAKAVLALGGLVALGALLNKMHVSETESEINSSKIIGAPVESVKPLPTVVESATSSEEPKDISVSDTSVFVPPKKVAPESKPFITTTEVSPTSASPEPDKRLKALEQEGGSHPAMVAYREMCKFVADELKIPNGPSAKKIASQLQKDVKEKMPSITPDRLVAEAKKIFQSNESKYEKLSNSLKK